MRTPSVYVRELGPGEGQVLKRMSRTAKPWYELHDAFRDTSSDSAVVHCG